MQPRFATVLVVLLGAWVGALAVLFIGVTAIFAAAPSRQVAGLVASNVFRRVDVFQLVVAALALSAAVGSAVLAGRNRAYWACAGIVALALSAVCVSALWLTPKIESMRLAGETSTGLFKLLHAVSMSIYAGLMATVVVALVWSSVLLAGHLTRHLGSKT